LSNRRPLPLSLLKRPRSLLLKKKKRKSLLRNWLKNKKQLPLLPQKKRPLS